MINITEELRNHFLTDSSTNNVVIDARIKGDGTVDYTNYYTGNVESYSEIMNTRSWNILANRFPESDSFKDYVNMEYFSTRTYFSISFNIHIQDITSLPEYLNIALYWRSKDGVNRYAPLANAINTAEYTNEAKRFSYYGNIFAGTPSEIDFFQEFNINVPDGEPDFIGTITISDIQIELGDDSSEFPRNYDISIDNENIVYESLTYKESLCSQDNIKFGLCEAPSAEVSIMNDNRVLNDARLRVYLQDQKHPYDYSLISTINWHYDRNGQMTPSTVYTEQRAFGWTGSKLFDTDITPYDYYFSMYGHIKVAFELKINSITGDGPTQLRFRLLGHYANNVQFNVTLPSESITPYMGLWHRVQFNLPYESNGDKVNDIERIYIYTSGGGTYTADYSIKECCIFIANEEDKNTPAPGFNENMCLIYNGTLEEYKDSMRSRVPLGTFRVTEVKRRIEHLLDRKDLTAYNYMITLEQNAADWYTQYVFGLSSVGYSGGGYEYARQIYSAFWDYMWKVGLDYRDNYEEVLVASYDKAAIMASYLSSKRLPYATGQHFDFRCAEFSVNSVDAQRYCVITTFDGDVGIIKQYLRDHYDPLCRGVVDANILIEETRTDHPQNRYVVNSGDYFMVSPDCTSFKVYIACYFEDTDDNDNELQILNSVTITKVTTPIELENGHIRLLYYNWNTLEIFPCETSITGRDVVRSLLEPCGCFFRLNRDTNIPEFVYCTKSGLYPAENLYPADDLYPRTGTDMTLSAGRYMSFERGENEVRNFGRIQIKKGGATNDTEPICQWEYIGNSNEINTYIIDDNIFYCGENMVYNSSIVEVSEMLEMMWYRISNMGYTANITRALGMPWIECGDRIGILTMVGGAETFVFRRTLKGIQMLTDTYESNGDEYVKAISNYNYGGTN